MLNKKRKEDIISYREFNELNSGNRALPSEDSPGSNDENMLRETLIGMEYDEDLDELDEHDEADEEEDILADHPAELDDEI